MNSSKIVVGVDGSPASITALCWAVRRAARDNAAVIAVEVGHRAQLAPGTSYAVQPYGLTPPPDRTTRPTRLHEAVTTALGSMRPAPAITELHAHGDPGAELARIAESADMLVLGHTRRSRLAEFILGSTATECLRHARCPVVLIPAGAPQ